MNEEERFVLQLILDELVYQVRYDEPLRTWVVEFESGDICQITDREVDLLTKFREGKQ